MRKNTIYEGYVREVFDFFKGCREGQGCFFFRQLNSRYRNDIEKVRMLTKVMLNLIDQNYFYCENDGDFIKLTETGYAYTQDGQLQEISINLKDVINIIDQNNPTFPTLWAFIGKDNEAPFYVTGPEYFNVAKSYVIVDAVTYGAYMKILQEKGKSPSRSIWYNTLFKGIKKNEMDSFLDSLSKVIYNAYNDSTPIEEADEEDYSIPAQPTTVQENNQEGMPFAKKVFVSYSHDSKEHDAWVSQFAERLQSKGILVTTDKDIAFGQDTNLFMEESIANADRILIIVTRKYKEKADGRMAGVGYETGVITGELVNDQNTIKFVPVIREGNGNQYYPRYLGNRWGADLKNTTNYDDVFSQLVSDILTK